VGRATFRKNMPAAFSLAKVRELHTAGSMASGRETGTVGDSRRRWKAIGISRVNEVIVGCVYVGGTVGARLLLVERGAGVFVDVDPDT